MVVALTFVDGPSPPAVSICCLKGATGGAGEEKVHLSWADGHPSQQCTEGHCFCPWEPSHVEAAKAALP